jgi:hypothetical protein
VLSVVPRPFTTLMIATEMPAAIRPYSMAVAPDSSAKNWRHFCDHGDGSVGPPCKLR